MCARLYFAFFILRFTETDDATVATVATTIVVTVAVVVVCQLAGVEAAQITVEAELRSVGRHGALVPCQNAVPLDGLWVKKELN